MERLFTLNEANRAIKLVQPIMRDIMEKMRQASELHENVKNPHLFGEISEVDIMGKLNDAERLLNKIEYHIKELESVGVMIRDLRIGIVDFPCVYQGRTVFLCWKAGEDSIVYWHEAYEGMIKRKPADASFLGESISA